MDPDRLIRISIVGWVLVLSFVAHFWIVGSELADLVSWIPNASMQAVAALAVGIAAGPVLGFWVSGWTTLIRRVYYHLPGTADEADQVFLALRRLITSPAIRTDLENVINRYRNAAANAGVERLKKELAPFISFLLHATAPERVVQFLTRRWNIFWMNANAMAAMAAGALLGIGVSFCCHPGHREPDLKRFLVEISILLAALPSVLHLRPVRAEIKQMLRQWLFAAADVPSKEILL